MLWGFWAKSHWLGEKAALVDHDFNLLPAGNKLLDLLGNEWNTRAQGKVEDGTFSFRGFYGEYEGKVTLENGRKVPIHFHLRKGVESQTVELR